MNLTASLVIVAVFCMTSGSNYSPALAADKQEVLDRSPVDCVLTPNERFLISTNQTSGTLSVVDLGKRQVVQEIKCGEYPTRLAITSDGKHVLASATFSHEVVAYDLDDKGQLKEAKRFWLGFEPRGIVIDKNNSKAYVALCTDHKVAVIDLPTMKEEARIAVGRWPHTLAITPDGKKLIATCSGDGTMSFVDLTTNKLLRDEPFTGLNQGQVIVSPDNEYVYAPYIYHFGSGPTERSIKLGWVTTSRIVRLRVNEAKRVASLYLDTQGLAVADPLGLAVTPDRNGWPAPLRALMKCSSSRTKTCPSWVSVASSLSMMIFVRTASATSAFPSAAGRCSSPSARTTAISTWRTTCSTPSR
ncbi:MAG: YncE family protein [Gemmatales bacterium]